jgi:hypothetical protein
MATKKTDAVAYFRTSSAANVGADKDSQRRQAAAVEGYAKGRARLSIVASFYDAAVSGADPVDARPGFSALLAHCEKHGVSVVLVENASRFARDLVVQLTGHALLEARGIELVPVDAPTYFTDPSPPPSWCAKSSGQCRNSRRRGWSQSSKPLETESGKRLVGARAAGRCRLKLSQKRSGWLDDRPRRARLAASGPLPVSLQPWATLVRLADLTRQAA